MMMKMFFGAIGGMNLAGETEVLGGNLPRRHFVHHKIPHDVFLYLIRHHAMKPYVGVEVRVYHS
jgi:hypothetical protein